MKLTELPSMLVERVDEQSTGTTVHGIFDRLDGVRESGSFRLKRGEYAWAELTIVDRDSGRARATVTYLDELRMTAGERYIWLDTYWQLPFVEAIADERTVWRRFSFQASDAQYFRVGKAVGWQKVGAKLRADAVPMEIKPGGWDHEHCDLCGGHIDSEHPVAYEDQEGHFLCSECYETYGADHDVSFQVGA
jgi:hypothetical protein